MENDGSMSGPVPWQMTFQEPATPVMERVVAFHGFLWWVIVGIALTVFLVLLYALWRFRASRNPSPRRFKDHLLLELVWTGIPCVILAVIAVPSMRILYFMDRVADGDVTVKVTGHQWYWTYAYPDHDLSFESVMIEDEKDPDLRLLSVDQPLVVPAGVNVRVLLTSADVIHSWAVPAFGIKKDTVPGRLSETWFRALKPGIYRGQCSELCGTRHGFMPIVVKVVPPHEFAVWLDGQKKGKEAENRGQS